MHAFKAGDGEIIESVRVPLRNPDFAPFLQRARDAKPQAIFVWVPGGLAGPFLRQYVERGLQTSGIKLIGPGDITDDDVLDQMGDAMLGITTSLQYSAAHPSAKNKAFVAAFERVGNGLRPDHVGVAAYDCMHLIYAALKKTGGDSNGDALLAAMKGMEWESPRGPIEIDPETRDIVQDVYIRRVERVNGELYNVEFDKYEAVKDPVTTSPQQTWRTIKRSTCYRILKFWTLAFVPRWTADRATAGSKRTRRGSDPNLAVAGVLKKQDGGPALMFTAVDDYDVPVDRQPFMLPAQLRGSVWSGFSRHSRCDRPRT